MATHGQPEGPPEDCSIQRAGGVLFPRPTHVRVRSRGFSDPSKSPKLPAVNAPEKPGILSILASAGKPPRHSPRASGLPAPRGALAPLRVPACLSGPSAQLGFILPSIPFTSSGTSPPRTTRAVRRYLPRAPVRETPAVTPMSAFGLADEVE